jgi:hypothetical protein
MAQSAVNLAPCTVFFRTKPLCYGLITWTSILINYRLLQFYGSPMTDGLTIVCLRSLRLASVPSVGCVRCDGTWQRAQTC